MKTEVSNFVFTNAMYKWKSNVNTTPSFPSNLQKIYRYLVSIFFYFYKKKFYAYQLELTLVIVVAVHNIFSQLRLIIKAKNSKLVSFLELL